MRINIYFQLYRYPDGFLDSMTYVQSTLKSLCGMDVLNSSFITMLLCISGLKMRRKKNLQYVDISTIIGIRLDKCLNKLFESFFCTSDVFFNSELLSSKIFFLKKTWNSAFKAKWVASLNCTFLSDFSSTLHNVCHGKNQRNARI